MRTSPSQNKAQGTEVEREGKLDVDGPQHVGNTVGTMLALSLPLWAICVDVAVCKVCVCGRSDGSTIPNKINS